MVHRAKNWLPIRGILLDVDGTLYRQMLLRVCMLLEILGSFCFRPKTTWQVIHIIRIFRKTRESLRNEREADYSLERIQYELVALKIKLPVHFVREVINEWMFVRPIKYMRSCKRRGALNFLNWCYENSIKIGAFSDYPTQEKLTALGLNQWFDLHLCSTDQEINSFKPSSKGLLAALNKWKLKPVEVIYVGDREDVDGAAAMKAGMRFIKVGNKKGQAWVTVKDFKELLNYRHHFKGKKHDSFRRS